jgi:hypothetical protein
VGLPPSITATTELVVPKSIPTTFAIVKKPLLIAGYSDAIQHCIRRNNPAYVSFRFF